MNDFIVIGLIFTSFKDIIPFRTLGFVKGGEMDRPLQIGISGFTSAGQVDKVVKGIGSDVPAGMQLRLGVSCSYHGLLNLPDPRNRPSLYAEPREIGEIFAKHYPGTSRVVHYSSSHPDCFEPFLSLREQVHQLMTCLDGQIDGLQLNDVNLGRDDLAWIGPDYPNLELTLPITGPIQRKIAGDPRLVTDADLRLFMRADYLLLDASAGSQQQLHPELVSACLKRFDQWELTAGRMLAGGLGPSLGDLLGPLAKRYRFGVDAEGRLRRDDVLQPDLAATYVRDSIALLSAI
jgi:hypothetical protein